jgi:hypothetical protein
MLTLAHRVAGQRVRNRRGNSTHSAVPAGSLPVERHVIPLWSQSADLQCQRRPSGLILILPGLNREMARPKMRAKREQFIKNHRSLPATRNSLNPGNERVLPISPASRDSFPTLPLLVSYKCTRNDSTLVSRGKSATSQVHQKRSHLCVFPSTLADELYSCNTPCAQPFTKHSPFGIC